MAADTTQTPERRDGTMDEALANGRQLLTSHPQMALQQAQAILRHEPANSDALRLAAAAHRALGEGEQAVNAEMAAIAASERVPALIAAARAIGQREFSEASRLAAEHLRHTPNDLAALTLSAESAIALGLPDKGEPLLRTVLARAPDFAPARKLLLNALMLLDRMTEARAELMDMIAQNRADEITQYQLLVRIESDLGNFGAAATASERILQLEQSGVEDWIGYGDSLRFSGRKSDAILAYRRALAMDPAHGRAWWSLADIDPKGITEADIVLMEQAVAERSQEPEHVGNLSFALGIAFDARALPAEAFPHFARGNELRRIAQPYDANELTSQIDRYLDALAGQAFPTPDKQGLDGNVPIFVIGMPRSGSTLVERILGRHSAIEGLGELSIVPHMMRRLKYEQAEGELEQRIASLPDDELERLGNWYLARASEHRRTEKPFFVDKLHMNWRHLPLILKMLPQARIVDVRRGALDCCWSNFKTVFARGHPAASDFGDIARFYCDYVRFTDALRGQVPERIHLVKYEDLVDDIEAQGRLLFDAIGIPLEDQCLQFHLSSDPVATASSEQVRQPLNRSGIGSWRRYEPWLGGLRDRLGPLATD